MIDPKPHLTVSIFDRVTARLTDGLKPCPFCGSPDVVAEEGYDEDGEYAGVEVGCKSCGVRNSAAEIEYAVEAWNRRA